MFFNSAESSVPEGSPGGEVGRAGPIGGGGQLRHGQPARHLHTAHQDFKGTAACNWRYKTRTTFDLNEKSMPYIKILLVMDQNICYFEWIHKTNTRDSDNATT
jgi:hypothetical protein